MILVTGSEMRAIDRAAIGEVGLPAGLLMEHAGRAVADEVLAHGRGPVAVVCGSGNNGGDGFVCARWLRERGVEVTVYLAKGRPSSTEAAQHLGIYEKLGGPVVELDDNATQLAGAQVIVDALFGTGLEREVIGKPATIIAAMNRAAAMRISIDLPSGLNADTGAVLGVAVRAHRTVTLGFNKLVLATHPSCELAGVVTVADIGIPRRLAAHITSALLDDPAVAPLAPRRALGGHKGSNGHVLVCAGSAGKVGAALLASSGALRAGAGLVSLAIPPDAFALAAGRVPEVMVLRFDPSSHGADEALVAAAQGMDVVVWGPGMPTNAAAGAVVRRAVHTLDVPLVLDADALNHLAQDPGVLRHARAEVVLTPHPGEAARLLGTGVTVAEVQADRIDAARRLCAATGAIVVLKGARTIVAHPSGRLAINPTGNPGMGTGGTGDILAGVIGGFIAQGMRGFAAACLGVYVHGRAGDLAVAAQGEIGLVAGDLLPELPRALRTLRTI